MGHVMFDPGLLHGVERISGQTLDGGDGLPLNDAYGVTAPRAPIWVDGAGTTLRNAAAKLGAGKIG